MTTSVVAFAGGGMTLLLCIPLCFGDVGGTAAASSASGTTASLGTVRAVPLQPVFADTPADGFPTNGFPYGQCTYWAAYNWRGPDGRGVTWSGNAWQWVANAAAVGIAPSNSPSVGAIAVFMRGNGYDASDGHVAVVTAVTPASYTVSEMNYVGPGQVDTRTIRLPDPHVLGFIPAFP